VKAFSEGKSENGVENGKSEEARPLTKELEGNAELTKIVGAITVQT